MKTVGSKKESLRPPRFMVFWRGRSMLTDRSIHPAVVTKASADGFGVEMEQVVSLGKEFNLEFFVRYRDTETRLRVKLKVIYCMILSANRGAYMEARIEQISDADTQTYNSILHALENAKEFDLRV